MYKKIQTENNKKPKNMIEKKFARELNYIHNEDIQNYAIEMLRLAPGYFFSAPSSSGGKYHPAYENAKGGLVIHTKAVVYYLTQFFNLDMVHFSEREKDLLIVSALLHDVKKNGNNTHCEFTQFDHPIIAANFITQYSDCGIISADEIKFVADAVISHMGQWNKRGNKELPLPESSAQKLLHICDYLASRKDIDLSQYLFNEENIMTVSELKSTKLTFGKYKGQTFESVFETDPEYLNWCYSKNMENQKSHEKTFMTLETLQCLRKLLFENL